MRFRKQSGLAYLVSAVALMVVIADSWAIKNGLYGTASDGPVHSAIGVFAVLAGLDRY